MRQWLVFLYLGCIAWGTSFLWIKLALREIGPMTMVSWRLIFGLAITWIILKWRKFELRWSGKNFWLPFMLGITSVAMPISLIGFAETRIDSGLAGVLNATMPLWTMVIAHCALHDEAFTGPKFLGLISGIAGIYILMNPDIGKERDVLGQVAMITATLLYASSTVVQRKYLRGVSPFQTGLPLILGGLISVTIAAAIFEAPYHVPQIPLTWLACAWMGILGMGISTLAWFYLINHWDATRTSLVTFVFPPTAVLLGVVFLDEPFHWDIVFGGGLIIAGIALVNLRRPRKLV
ncbi:MAG: DMT family transporter [Calditrichaeota bacterium]|nr:DMT family transporter [Calditrichota bacterium]